MLKETLCNRKDERQALDESRDCLIFGNMVGTSPVMVNIFEMIRKVAVNDFPVLITGASGTGKELVAQAVHRYSHRHNGPFVVVNCAAIPRELMEAELFGHERGAFTGAYQSQMGKVELAQGGTLFLDEIGELSLEMQVKLLRFLQEYTFERVGGRQIRKADVRVISATNRNLSKIDDEIKFREDLYYRLNVINLQLPTLKERGNDILLLSRYFLERFASETGKTIKGFTRKAEQVLMSHSWPGNVRELMNYIRRAVVLADTSWIVPENIVIDPFPTAAMPLPDNGLGLKEAKARFEAELVGKTLAQCGWNVELVAEMLKTSRSMIYNLINKHNLALGFR
ncbi:MAG: sigma-54 dependent transcriptional regulator [Deltaproteobacteria bacterium]|nr:sigma-54 dependent transcriptional regulator [Deltaproteobacteria bacterium]